MTNTKPATSMELVQRASKTIISPAYFKSMMAKKSKVIGSTKTAEIIDAIVADYMTSTMHHDVQKDFTPGDFALWVNLQVK
jgi:hypothetical protein